MFEDEYDSEQGQWAGTCVHESDTSLVEHINVILSDVTPLHEVQQAPTFSAHCMVQWSW
jgi:hypothetical protein